jgi:hypothetical protein
MAQFDDVSNWAAFDPGEHGVGNDPDGYWGVLFDGRYLYFTPGHNGSAYHGEVLRYDVTVDFAVASSWTTYEPGANGVGYDPKGYWGGAFDGRYTYFAPFQRGSFVKHGEVLRYDTTGVFLESSSWAAFDAGSHGVGNEPDGYNGAAFDGRYVYFAPFVNNTRYHGEVLRYDTTGIFDDPGSWEAYEAGIHGVGDNAFGYGGAIFTGRYIYFAPLFNDTGPHGEVLRFDTAGGFSDVSSWSAYDPGANGIGDTAVGYRGTVFDGRYVYFVPMICDTGLHGEVLRYDTLGDFFSIESWAAFDPGEHGVGDNPDGYSGKTAFDGRYLYFAPHYDEVPDHEEVLRYDTTRGFADPDSWDVYDPMGAGVTTEPEGRVGSVFDGRYVYFAPSGGDHPHGEVLRYDTAMPEPIPTVSEWGLVVMTLLVLTVGSVLLVRTRRSRIPV